MHSSSVCVPAGPDRERNAVGEAGGGPIGRGERIADLDTSVVHPARVYDYWLGGKDNFSADREAAEPVLAAAPGLRFRVRAADNTHEVAQRAAPDCRVVYVDNDPIVLLHAQALLPSTPQGSTGYLQADLRDPGMTRRYA
jgi:S-adenosyl methyltransferase